MRIMLDTNILISIIFFLRSDMGIYQTGGAWEPDCVMRLCD